MPIFLLAWPGAVAIGVSLGLLGSGGSILTVPVLVYLLGQPEKVAIAGSLAIVALISAFAALHYLRDRLVDWRSVLWFGLPGMAGTYGGAYLSQFASGAVQMAVFALVMLLASLLMIRPLHLETGSAPRAPAKIVVDGLLVGVLTGFVGVGGGFLVVPALVLLGGLPMQRAVGTSLVIIALKSLTGFVKYQQVLDLQGLQLDYGVIALFAGLGIAGSFYGKRLALRLDQDRLRVVFGYFLIAMGVLILAQSVVRLV
jgi:hypothetical protein